MCIRDSNIRRCIICGRYFLLKSGVHALYCEGACPHAPGYTCRQFGTVELQKELAKEMCIRDRHMSSVYYLKDGKIAKASETLFEDRLYY